MKLMQQHGVLSLIFPEETESGAHVCVTRYNDALTLSGTVKIYTSVVLRRVTYFLIEDVMH
eukprot:5595942-Amphidinium_carterae.1